MSVKQLVALVVLLAASCAAQTSPVFYGSQISLTGDPNVNYPSDFLTPTQPPVGNGTPINNNRPSNAATDTSWGTPVWRAASSKNVCNTSWAWSISIDDLHRWIFCTTTNADTTGYATKWVYNLWDGSQVCAIGYMQQGGPGHANVIREPYSGTGYVTAGTLTVVTGSIPLDKSMTATDITINGVVYQIATDTGTNATLVQTVTVGSAGSPVAFSGGWNDQDVAYGLYPPSQIARVNIRVCNAVAPSKVTSPTDPSWETWDTINGGTGYTGTNLFYNGYLCGGSSDMSDDGNTFCVSDNTNSTGNTYDPRLYTLGSKNAGTWTAAIPRYAWNSLSALNCALSATTCTITTTGSPGYPIGAALQIENANITGSGPGARGLKYMTCYVSVVTDANNYTVNGCPTQTVAVTETSGFVNEELRSAMTVEQADNFPTIGAGIGKTYLQGTENNTHNGGGNSLFIWDPSTATMLKDLTDDAGHITRFVYNGDLYLTQYAGKPVNTAGGPATMAGCSGSVFMWNSRTDAMTCMFPNGMDLGQEYYSTSTPARRGLSHPYIVISQFDDTGYTGYSSLTNYVYASRPTTAPFFLLTDSAVAGSCNSGGGGTHKVVCDMPSGASDYIPYNTTAVEPMSGTSAPFGTSVTYTPADRWGHYLSASNPNGGTRYITNEVFIYDLVNNVGYHMMHPYSREISPFYLNANDFNALTHVTCSRDGILCSVDSSYGSAQDVAGYVYQVLRDPSSSTSAPLSGSVQLSGGTVVK